MVDASGVRVLWATEEVPDFAQGGGNVRQAHLLRAVAAQASTDLLLLGSLADADLRRSLQDVTELPHPGSRHLTPAVRRGTSIAMALTARSHLEHVVTEPARSRLAAALADRATAYDLVVVIHELMARVAPARRSGVWALEFHHVLSEMFAQQAATQHGRRRWLHRREAAAAARMERAAIADYDLVITCTEVDAQALSRVAAGPFDHLLAPNGVDLSSYRASAVPAAPRVLLPATLDYTPNVDGARWFCDEVLPRVLAAHPDATFDIVGRRPIPEVQRLAERPAIELHADVPAMAPWFERARVVVVPLRVGTGSRLKALEAMASGRPVVGTTIGLGGLDVVDGEHAVVVDDAAGFADAVSELLRDDDRSAAIGAGGRALVEECYDWDRIGARFAEELLGRVAAPAKR